MASSSASDPQQDRTLLLTGLAFGILALAIYWPALRGPFISDDFLYIVFNPFTELLSLDRLVAIFDPGGEARFATVNYAPLHLLATAIERHVFWDDTLGYHVVNVLLHALNATLLSALLRSSGIALLPAVLGGLLFLAHPANVEAVAWISQLKTDLSLALCLSALLLFRRHPGFATLPFAAGLLVKTSTALALPFVAALAWCGSAADPQGARRRWAWIGVWAVLFALYSVPQHTAINPRGLVDVPAYEDLGVHLRSMASVGVHYLVMAYTSLGVSHTQELPPVTSVLDPWWLAALPLSAFFVWRIVSALRSRSEEAAYWLAAAAGFAPISQWYPFSHPIADRYLYFILPGLIGGTLLLLRDAWARRAARRGETTTELPLLWRRAAVGSTVALLLVFGARAEQRAGLWIDQVYLSLDSARNFPEGRSALYLEAQQAAQLGDLDTAVARIRRAAELGRDDFRTPKMDPALTPIYRHPDFEALIRELAALHVERIHSRSYITQSDLNMLAQAYFELGRFDEAERALEQGIEMGGLIGDGLVPELEGARALRAALEAERANAFPPE